jgi:photosystem II stability/assembly factor-like uncharacterized protein
MLVVKVDREGPTNLREQVAAETPRAIGDGDAKPGERLPAAKDLAAELGVNGGFAPIDHDPLPVRDLVVDDADALIEEAHRRARRRRRRGALIAAAALAALGVWLVVGGGGGGNAGLGTRLGSGFGGSAPSRAQEAQEARQIARVAANDPIGEAQLLTAGTGWAMNGLALYWTRDDGRTWRVVEPPVLRTRYEDVIAKVGNIDYVAPGHIWITMNDLFATKYVDGSDRYATIARSTNDGRTWRSGAPPGCERLCGSQNLSFLSATRGYMLAGLDSDRGNRLYDTTDGGATWVTVAHPPLAGALRFTTASDAWAVSDPSRWIDEGETPVGGGDVYRSLDGGRSWQRVRLTPPPQYAGMSATASAAAFFGAQHGVIGVRYRKTAGGAQRLVVFTTADGGRGWIPHLTPAAADLRADQWGVAEGLAFSAPSARDWLFFAGHTLYATSDSGHTWTAAPLGIAAATPYDLSFASPTTGWALLSVGTGTGRPPALVRTTDGGRTWTALAPRSQPDASGSVR